MARMIPAALRIKKARALIEKARKLPLPEEGGRYNFSYIAEVKTIMQDARDLIKFIPYAPSTSPETKAEVEQLFADIDRAQQEILHPQ